MPEQAHTLSILYSNHFHFMSSLTVSLALIKTKTMGLNFKYTKLAKWMNLKVDII